MNGLTLRGGPAPQGAGLAANDNARARAAAPGPDPATACGFLLLRSIAGVLIQTRAAASTASGLFTQPLAHDPALIEIRLQLASGRSLAIGIHDEDSLIAAWRQASEAYGLPMLARAGDGLFAPIIPMLGAVQIGTDRRRRRVAALTSRRPRFLARRKTAIAAMRPAFASAAPRPEPAR